MKIQMSKPKKVTIQFDLEPNCVAALEELGNTFFPILPNTTNALIVEKNPHAKASIQRSCMAHWLLASAVMDIKNHLPKMTATVRYAQSEGFENIYDYIDAQIKQMREAAPTE